MPPINYASPMQGKLFSLAQGKGSISGLFQDEVIIWVPRPGYMPIPPAERVDLGIDRITDIMSNNIIDSCIQWSFISLTGNKFILTCRSPRTGKTHVMTCSEYPNICQTVKVNHFDLPVNTENVDRANQFTLTYVEQSPCFFYLKNADNLYLATTTESVQILGLNIGILTFFTEDQKNNPAINANCVWFIDTIVDRIRQVAGDIVFIDDQDIKRPVSFADISEKVNKTIDMAYLNTLMGR
ncbi:hypothetical protein PQ469_08865 [Mucilaginibacter sp. KACC 22773]|uniref:hypothetical protein n=1 Tax=Mucilaginibacter sp. KACC 22773 TaxID=3025671 RepID=UPI002365C34D|nr:hypothetical protein [Mucilaginibacter sp. KACC 22773]WDF80115.1 hypothetical protein PQ469_08865 [Mucilaginibacter sp. KACC 22773]